MFPLDLAILCLTASAVLYALVGGGQPERWCTIIVAAGVIFDRAAILAFGARSFETFDPTRMLIDGIQMSFFLVVALKANRVYPLGIASAQLVTIIGSASAILVPNGWTQAYWAMTQLPIILQLSFLAIGTLAHRRRVARIGDYNGWSPTVIIGAGRA